MEASGLMGTTAVITGATSGIGRAVAVDLARRGAAVQALGRHGPSLLALVAELGLGARAWPVELEDEAQTRAQIEALKQACPQVDVLVHSAGVVQMGPVAEAPIADLDFQYRVNVRAPYLLTQLLLDRLLASQGQVVFINSGVGLTARGGWSQYAISKHGLKALADALREEVKPKGVRVLSVYPGRTATPMQEKVRAIEGQPYNAEDFLRPQDVSHMIAEALLLPRSADVIDLNIRPGRGP